MRKSLIGTLTAAAVLVAGCTSQGGPPVQSTSAPPSAPPTSSATSAAASSTVGSPAPSSAVQSPPAVGSAPVPTVGGTGSALDGTSSKWFSTFCNGFAPVLALSKSVTSPASTDSAATQKNSLVAFYGKVGTSFTGTAAALGALSPPTFSGGDALATKVVTALGAAGPQFTRAGMTLAAVDLTKNPAALKSAQAGLRTSLLTALAPLQDLGLSKTTPQTQAAIRKLPDCAHLALG